MLRGQGPRTTTGAATFPAQIALDSGSILNTPEWVSTDALPAPAAPPAGAPPRRQGTPLDGRRGASTRMNRLRLLELQRLRGEGMADLDAWKRITTDAKIGIARDRARGTVTDERALRTLAAALERARPGAMAAAAAEVKDILVAAAGPAAQVIADLSAGEFGEGKVTVRGERETIAIDATAERVRLDASKFIVGAAVGITDRPAAAGAVQAVQVNVGGQALSPHEIADALDRDPELREKAIDLSRKIQGVA